MLAYLSYGQHRQRQGDPKPPDLLVDGDLYARGRRARLCSRSCRPGAEHCCSGAVAARAVVFLGCVAARRPLTRPGAAHVVWRLAGDDSFLALLGVKLDVTQLMAQANTTTKQTTCNESSAELTEQIFLTIPNLKTAHCIATALIKSRQPIEPAIESANAIRPAASHAANKAPAKLPAKQRAVSRPIHHNGVCQSLGRSFAVFCLRFFVRSNNVWVGWTLHVRKNLLPLLPVCNPENVPFYLCCYRHYVAVYVHISDAPATLDT